MMRTTEDDHLPDAAYWVARMDSGHWTRADEDALAAWLGDDPARHADLMRTGAAWASLDARAESEMPAPVLEADVQPRWPRRRMLAAGLAGLVALGGGLWMVPRSDDFATNVGEIRRVPLNDGSVMIINSASELSVRLEPSSRNVELARGEAWFEVAKDPSRPFIVSAGDVRARAVGTAFSVRRRSEGTEVNVTQGVVETWAANHTGKPLRLKAGSRVLITENAVTYLDGGEAGSNENALAWRNGLINLSGSTLADAASEFNRYNSTRIVVVDPAIAGVEMAGVFRINDPRGFVTAIQTSLGVRVDESNPREIRIEALPRGAN